MSNALMYAQMGLSGMQGLAQYASVSVQAKLEKSMQEYRNTMSELAAARALNAVTVNEIRSQDATTQATQMIQRQAIQDQGRQAVAAAAAGVKGNSIEMAARDLRASAGRASYAQERQHKQALTEMGEQRTSIAIGAVLNTEVSVIPKPSVGSMLLGVGTNLLDIYDSHQPEGSKILGPNGGSVKSKNLL